MPARDYETPRTAAQDCSALTNRRRELVEGFAPPDRNGFLTKFLRITAVPLSVPVGNLIRLATEVDRAIAQCFGLMREACSLVWLALVGLFRSRASLEAAILILRHQLNIQRRQSSKRLNFSTLDRLIFAGLYRLAPSVLGALAILKPETVIRWHRAGFRSYWGWKSRHRGGWYRWKYAN